MLVPATSPENVNVASTPEPAGPGGVAPRLAQPKRSVPVPGRNCGHDTVRPVLPRKPPSLTETNEINVGSQIRPISYAPRLETLSTVTSNVNVPVWMTCCAAGSTLIKTGRIGVGVAVGPSVGEDVGVLVGVSVGHGPPHGVGVGVSVGVPVCVGVGVVVGVLVGVGHGPLHGPMTREPEIVCAANVVPLTSVTSTSLSVSGVTPSAFAVNATDARMPLPFGPGGALPSVTHVSCAVPVAIVPGRQNSVRPVLLMNGPAVIDVAVTSAGSKLSVSWNAPTFVACWIATAALNDVPFASVSASGSTHTARPMTPQSMTGVGVNVGVVVGVFVGVLVGQMPPGHGVGVNVGVAVGPLSMTAEPS